MEKEHEIVRAVYAAKTDNDAADTLIRRYLPYIRAESSKFMGRICTESDDGAYCDDWDAQHHRKEHSGGHHG